MSLVDNLVKKIQKEYQLYAPIKQDQELFITRVEDIEEIDYSGKMPLNSWKHLFLPPDEALFDYQHDWQRPSVNYPKLGALNMTVLDLKALGLLDLVFEDDPYYQERRRQILVMGLSVGVPTEQNFQEWKLFSLKLEENILEHLPFDIFLAKNKIGDFKIYAGSEKGQKILEKSSITNYENVKFAGLISEEGLDPKMVELEKAVRNSKDHKLWDELDKICLACGKCSVVCPTCFCFDFEDEPKESSISRKRVWGNCFYPEFTKIAGGQDYTVTVKNKLQFWYEHKFVRIPKEYKVPGCVSCNRCTKVCPVGIDIVENLSRLSRKSNDKSIFTTSRRNSKR